MTQSMLASATFVTGMTPGSQTITAKYKVNGSAGTFSNRSPIVIPIP